MIASTLNTVIGQRLVRRVTQKRTTYTSSELQTKEINDVLGELLPKSQEQVAPVSESLGYQGLPILNASGYTLVKGFEDKDSPGGYKGRAGLYETIEVDEDIQKLITAKATANDIMKVAKAKGTVTMRQDGMLKALSGITTVDEVNRVSSDIA